MLTFLLTLRKQIYCCTPSIMTTTLASHPALTKILQHLHQLYKMDHHKRLISLPDTNKPTAESLMNSKITSSLGRRILKYANHLIDGGGDAPHYPICIVLLETYFLFLVSIFHLFSTVHGTKAHIRFCSCSQAHFLWWAWHYFCATCKSSPWHHLYPDACQTSSSSGLSWQLLVLIVFLNTILDVLLSSTRTKLAINDLLLVYPAVHHIRPFMAIQTPILCRQGSKKKFMVMVYSDPVIILAP